MVRRLPHKFRFQLLHRWLVSNYAPCRAADVGGGKGLLAYLLRKSGWDAVVIDPTSQRLKYKYKDLENGKRVKLSQEEQVGVPRIDMKFEKEMAEKFDLLIGLHAHGSNMYIIDAAKQYNRDFVLLPCCVIDEPIEKRIGVNWFESLVEYGKSLGQDIKTDKLNFVGNWVSTAIKLD